MARRGGARPGAGRKASDPEGKRRRLSTTIANHSWQILQELAAQEGGSVGKALDALIAAAATERGLPVPVGRAMKVLVVDDDPHSRELLQLRLEAMGCQVLCTSTAEEGFALAREERPSLAIVDLELHGDKQAGLGLIARLRGDKATAQIPLAVHSIFVFHPGDLPLPLAQVDAMLPKPFTRAQLQDVLERTMGHRDDGTEVVII